LRHPALDPRRARDAVADAGRDAQHHARAAALEVELDLGLGDARVEVAEREQEALEVRGRVADLALDEPARPRLAAEVVEPDRAEQLALVAREIARDRGRDQRAARALADAEDRDELARPR